MRRNSSSLEQIILLQRSYKSFTYLNKWSVTRMMVINDGVITCFVVRADIHPSTHVAIIVRTVVQYIAVEK